MCVCVLFVGAFVCLRPCLCPCLCVCTGFVYVPVTGSVRRDTVPPCFLHLLALDSPQGNLNCPMAVAVIVA